MRREEREEEEKRGKKREVEGDKKGIKGKLYIKENKKVPPTPIDEGRRKKIRKSSRQCPQKVYPRPALATLHKKYNFYPLKKNLANAPRGYNPPSVLAVIVHYRASFLMSRLVPNNP